MSTLLDPSSGVKTPILTMSNFAIWQPAILNLLWKHTVLAYVQHMSEPNKSTSFDSWLVWHTKIDQAVALICSHILPSILSEVSADGYNNNPMGMISHLLDLYATTLFNLWYNTLHDFIGMRQHAGESGSAFVG